jgi:hypothetical protein
MPKPPRRKRVWCFQSRSETTADDGVWIAFEKKNQIKLNERFDNRSTDCDIRDKSIFGGEVTLKVMLGQSIGFIVDPESQQDVYQIECWPEMYWWQRLQYRLRSRKKIRNNPLYTHV